VSLLSIVLDLCGEMEMLNFLWVWQIFVWSLWRSQNVHIFFRTGDVHASADGYG